MVEFIIHLNKERTAWILSESPASTEKATHLKVSLLQIWTPQGEVTGDHA